MSLSSSHWDTDLEDDDSSDDKQQTDQEIYEQTCQTLGVTPVSRFSKEIGQEEVKISHRHLREMGAKAMAIVLANCTTTTKVGMYVIIVRQVQTVGGSARRCGIFKWLC